jgi:hypothetical protein
VIVNEPRRYRAGQQIEDYCRACKVDRMHTVMAADSNGHPIRVTCGYCNSEHNYRGGGRMSPSSSSASPSSTPSSASSSSSSFASSTRQAPPVAPRAIARPAAEAPFPLVSDRERIAPPMSPDSSSSDSVDIELLLRRVIREEIGLTPVAPAAKWRGGQIILRPGNSELQEKSLPIETFFHKIVMLRNRLRTLEQQVNATEMPEDVKVKLQSYITGCYGSLTSFNILFADEDDKFRGTSE